MTTLVKEEVWFTIAQDKLETAIAAAKKFVAHKATLPALGCLLFDARHDTMLISATNLETAVTLSVAVECDDPFAVAVPAAIFSDLVSNIAKGDNIAFSIDRRTLTLTVRSGRTQSNIKCMDADSYPAIPTMSDASPSFTMAGDMLREAVAHTAFAATMDDNRPVLTGVLIERPDTGKATIVSADGFRLAVYEGALEETPDKAGGGPPVIVPAKALKDLASIVDPAENVTVYVTANESHIIFQHAGITVAARLISGNFPNFRQIIPKAHESRTTLDRIAFLKAVKLASTFARDAANIVRVQVKSGDEFTPSFMVIGANAAEVGDSACELDVKLIGVDVEIAFNAKYLIDVLSVITTSEVVLETQSPSHPGVFKPVSRDRDGYYQHVIMPMHLANK